MRMPPRISLAVAAAVLCALALAPVAGAASPLDEYQTSGKVTPCKYSASQLNQSVPNDVAQYAPDYAAALQDAARAKCGSSGAAASQPTQTNSTGAPVDSNGTPLPPGTTYVRKPPRPTAQPALGKRSKHHLPLQTTSHTTTPAPVIALGILLLLGLFGGALAGVWRYMGWGLDWLNPARHAFGEAGARAWATFGGVAQWVRLRRSRGDA